MQSKIFKPEGHFDAEPVNETSLLMGTDLCTFARPTFSLGFSEHVINKRALKARA